MSGEGVPLYDDFASAYDLMVDWPSRLANEAPFFERLFGKVGVSRVIDVACGTGHHARLFASWGLDVVGADASEEMIRQARAAPAPGRGLVEWVATDFLHVAQAVQGPFDAVVCLGNSLPHLGSSDEVVRALTGFGELLRPGGVLVLQMRSADRLYGGGPRLLGPSARDADGVRHLFVRLYGPEPDHLDLTIVSLVEREGSWSAQADTTRLVPLFFDDLIVALEKAGLTGVDSFADYQETPFDVALCDDLLVTAIRP